LMIFSYLQCQQSQRLLRRSQRRSDFFSRTMKSSKLQLLKNCTVARAVLYIFNNAAHRKIGQYDEM
jgi:hypothetical protein